MERIELSAAVMPKVIASGQRHRDKRMPIVVCPFSNAQRGSFYFVQRQKGRANAVWHKIGVWPDVSVADARAFVKRYYSDVSRGDSAAHVIDRLNFNDFKSVGDVLRWYQSDRLSANNLSASRTANLRSAIRRLDSVASLPVHELRVAAVRKLVDRLNRTYKISTIDLTLRTLKQAVDAAILQQLIDPVDTSLFTLKTFTSARVEPKPQPLNPAHLANVKKRIAQAPEKLQFLMHMILAYGFRIQQACELSWIEHVDLKNNVIRFAAHETKNRQALTVPITDIMRERLLAHRRWLREHGHRGLKLFPGKTNPRRAINASYASRLISTVLKNGTAHDLRKMARSCWLAQGVDYHVAEMMLNHKKKALDGAYINSVTVQAVMRNALTAWHASL